MIAPTLSLSGTSRDRLLTDLQEACDATRTAFHALVQTAPNARDYSPEDLRLAVAAHVTRLQRIDEVRRELQELQLAIANAPALRGQQ